MEDNRVALLAIIVESPDSVEGINKVLHEYREAVIGRMGIPYKERQISIISVAVDANANTISAMAGKIGKLDGVSVKTVYSKV